ncbi:SRPBCC family protein [Iamia majanohamensis]|uniref:SRPBCC family protein n=1 Tax=Iamia majanohamensis TaxID=467976 RepID=A0AAE9Y651_9ACTN|nr:SRPBCC family protein [Iamia majanohamensis]WCO67350.1 SRPBCC family protein [Iamia majanohamensis]
MASVLETVDVDVPVEDAYALWSQVERWPDFLPHVERVARIDDTTFHWWLRVAGADEGFTAELTEVRPGERIAWRTVEGVEHAGVVTFHHLDDGHSRVALQIEYEPEGFLQVLGALTNLDDVLAGYDLGRFKAEVEGI